MTNIKISALPTAVSIDAINDFLPIVNNGNLDTEKINRNVFLGIAGAPLGTTDSQVVSNKTIGVTNTITAKDTLFTLQDDGDLTKQAKFQLSGLTTATTRTYTLPDASSTLADISSSQTFTNKTLTSPVITGGSMSNTTISVDSISEFTVGNGVSISSLNIKNGKLNTNNSVVGSNITAGAVTPNSLVASSGTSWTWQSWTPTFTNLTVGNGTLVARYTQVGKNVTARISLIFGSTSAVSGDVSITLPVTAFTYAGASTVTPLGNVQYYNNSTIFLGNVSMSSTTSAVLRSYVVASTYPVTTTLSSTVPFSWAVTHQLSCQFTYEAA